MPDPASWLVVEPGWEVVGSDDERVGEVREIVGDSGKDIFNGLVVSPGLLKSSRYVPAELVGPIVDGRVSLTIDSNAFESLDAHEEPPPSEQFRAP